MINWEKVREELFDIIDRYKKELEPSDLDEGPDEEFDIIKKKISQMWAGFSKDDKELEEKISDNQKFSILESALVKFCNDISRDYSQDKSLSNFNKMILNFLQDINKKLFCYDKQFILFLGKEDSSIYPYALQKKWRNLDRQKKVTLVHLYQEDQLEISAEFKNPDPEKITYLRIGVIGHHTQGDNFLYSHSPSSELESISVEETIDYIMKLLKANPCQFLIISLQACEAALPAYGMFYSQSFAGKLHKGIYKKCHESKITTSICVQARTNNFSSKFNLLSFKKTSLPQNRDKTTAKLRFITQNGSQYLQDAYNAKIIGQSDEFYPEKDSENLRFFVKK